MPYKKYFEMNDSIELCERVGKKILHIVVEEDFYKDVCSQILGKEEWIRHKGYSVKIGKTKVGFMIQINND